MISSLLLALWLGHNLEVLQGVVCRGRLGLLFAAARSVAHGDREGGQLQQALALASEALLLDVEVCGVEVGLERNVLQHLHEVDALGAERNVLDALELRASLLPEHVVELADLPGVPGGEAHHFVVLDAGIALGKLVGQILLIVLQGVAVLVVRHI